MKLKNKTLDDWLKKPLKNAQKRGGDDFPFSERYITFKHYLDNNLHKEVTKQAIYMEFLKSKDIDHVIYLNDHGPDHIQTVVERASQLLDNEIIYKEKVDLNAREVFFLLNAIQVHDIGNFYGRYNHEAKVFNAVREGLTPILFDDTEKKYINNIAQVHGGKVKYKDGSVDKNTIGQLKPKIASDGYDVRQQLLASILRFADELADDKYRADVKTLREGTMPKGSEIFHAYASCLDTVKIVHTKKTVELHFKVPKDFTLRKFGKISKKKDNTLEVKSHYLINEIYVRTLKMHNERIYCSKFWKELIDIDKIWVNIEFYSNTNPKKEFNSEELFVHDEITFTLHDNSYPTTMNDIFSLCPTLTYSDGTKINGMNLKKEINKS